jgi:uncharacterized protein YxjI
MPVCRPKLLKFNLIIGIALSMLLSGVTTAALAEVVHFKKLLPFVDVKIPGWTMKGKPSGSTLKQGPMKMSQVRASFTADGKNLEIIVMDFLGKPFPFMMGQHMEMETSEEIVRTTEVQGFKGLEQYHLKDKEGELNIRVANRFWVKIDGKGIDNLKVLQDVAQKLELKKLAALAK